MNDPQTEPYEPEGMAIDQGLSVSAPPTRQTRRGPRAQQPRDLAREPSRSDGVVTGRNGEILSRKRLDDGKDIFDIPEDLKEPGWDYQWCAVSIVGNTEILLDQNLMFAENGWRPVPSDRWPGRFMQAGHKGPIIRGSQMLMERPKALGDEARAEMVAKARRLVNDRDQALMGGKANLRGAMRDGIAMGGKYRGTGGDLRMSIDRAIDIPAPQHAPADDDVA